MSSLNTESSTEDGVVALTEHQLIEGALIDAVRDALDGVLLAERDVSCRTVGRGVSDGCKRASSGAVLLPRGETRGGV